MKRGINLQFIKKHLYDTVSEQTILNVVQNEPLLGMLEVDISVPESWDKCEISPRDFFKEMPPLFMTTEVQFSDIGTCMIRILSSESKRTSFFTL